MPQCGVCGQSIFFSGIRDENGVYYCKNCRAHQLDAVAANMSDNAIAEHVAELHNGSCPRCGGLGPIDIHTSHTVVSVIFFTSWNSHPMLCCHKCGRKASLIAAVTSGVFGWWGFPFGLILTPVQVVRNIKELVAGPSPQQPSRQLRDLVRRRLIGEFVSQVAQPESQASESGTPK